MDRGVVLILERIGHTAFALILVFSTYLLVGFRAEAQTVELNRNATFFNHKSAKSPVRIKSFCRSYIKKSGELRNDLDIERIRIVPRDVTKTAGGNSLSWGSQHTAYQRPIIELSTVGYLCENEFVLKKIASLLTSWSEQGSFLDSIVKSKGDCWRGGNPKASCSHHLTEEVALIFNAITHAWLLNLGYFESLDSYKELRNYIILGNERIVKYQATRTRKFRNYPNGGIYAQLNQANGMMLHALLVNDVRLFNRWKMDGVRKFKFWVKENGLIFNNSFRGTRSVHYHGLAVDSLAQFKKMIELQGDSLSNYDLDTRYWRAVDQAILAFSNPKKFEAKGFKGKNHTTDEASAIRGFSPDNRAWLFIEKSYVTQSDLGDQFLFDIELKNGKYFAPGQMTGWAYNTILRSFSDFELQ